MATGGNADVKELKAIASVPSSEYMFTVDRYGALETIKNLLAYKTCEGKYIGQLFHEILNSGVELLGMKQRSSR